jgi:hypothetical protein
MYGSGNSIEEAKNSDAEEENQYSSEFCPKG